MIKKPRIYYYDKKGEVGETNGDEAGVYMNENELDKLELRGGIEVTFQGYVLKSEEANYMPAKDQIVLPTRTNVTGEGMELEGASMEVELEGQKIRMLQRENQDRARQAGQKEKERGGGAADWRIVKYGSLFPNCSTHYPSVGCASGIFGRRQRPRPKKKQKRAATALNSTVKTRFTSPRTGWKSIRRKIRLLYKGRVVTVQSEMTMRSETLTAYYEAEMKQMKQIVAEGKVNATQGAAGGDR